MKMIAAGFRSVVWSFVLFAIMAFPATSQVIYRLDLQNGAGPEWSDTRILQTPTGRNFLGEFGVETNFLALNALPAHTNLIISFDLAILRSWDGNGGSPDDTWELRLLSTDGSADIPLLRTTFSQNRNNGPQWFPNTSGQGTTFLARTGASELDSLGYTTRDSVYRITVAFPHAGDSATFGFLGLNLQSIADESWAVGNLVVGHGPMPSISFKNLINDLPFIAPADINVEADVIGQNIARVDFLTNGVLVASKTQAPYSVTLTNVAAGVIPVTARAVTSSGLSRDVVAAVIVNGLSAQYYDTETFQGLNVSRVDPFVNYAWDTRSAVPGLGNTSYSVRWTGYLLPEYSEPYTLFVSTDDGARLWIDGVRVIDEWTRHGEKSYGVTIPLTAGRRHQIQMDYFNGSGGAVARLQWSSPSLPKQPIPQFALEPFLTPTNHSPNRPVITEPNQIGNPVDSRDTLVLSADFFSDPDRGQTNVASDWEIWTMNPPQRIWASLGAIGDRRLATTLRNGVFENSHAGRTNLVPNLTYRVRTRQQDSSGNLQTAWSEYGERVFDTIERRTLIENTFDTDVAEWTATFHDAVFTDTGGRSGGGVLFAETRSDGSTSYWRAPLAYLGDKTEAYGGVFSFDLRQENTANQFDAPDVILQGGDLSLVFDLPVNPSPNWTSYAISLSDQADWRLGTLDGPPATKAQILTALADITQIVIRGEYNDGAGETNYIDNVKLTAPPTPDGIHLNVAFQTANELELWWPLQGADFVLEQRALIDRGEWQPITQQRRYEDSRVAIKIARPNATQFFRLRKEP